MAHSQLSLGAVLAIVIVETIFCIFSILGCAFIFVTVLWLKGRKRVKTSLTLGLGKV